VSTDTTETPASVKRCFSGSGRYANRKWAPGGDATYLSRLRKAHLAGETVPDPWFIQDHGGIESENVPAEGWPQLSPLDVANRLDQERGGGVDSHWVHTLENARGKAEAKAQARSERAKTTAQAKAQRDEERARQKQRPRKDTRVRRTGGEYDGQEAVVVRTISPTQLLVRFDGGMEELVTDDDVEVIDQPANTESADEQPAEAEFQEA
jgi:hypothetical protein